MRYISSNSTNDVEYDLCRKCNGSGCSTCGYLGIIIVTDPKEIERIRELEEMVYLAGTIC